MGLTFNILKRFPKAVLVQVFICREQSCKKTPFKVWNQDGPEAAVFFYNNNIPAKYRDNYCTCISLI